MRISGPAMYQSALHKVLTKSKCRIINDSLCDALRNPEMYCQDMDTFRSLLPNGLNLLPHVNLNETLAHKLFYPAGSYVKETQDIFNVNGGAWDYDDADLALRKDPDARFCDADEFDRRAKIRAKAWKVAAKKMGN